MLKGLSCSSAEVTLKLHCKSGVWGSGAVSAVALLSEGPRALGEWVHHVCHCVASLQLL